MELLGLPSTVSEIAVSVVPGSSQLARLPTTVVIALNDPSLHTGTLCIHNNSRVIMAFQLYILHTSCLKYLIFQTLL